VEGVLSAYDALDRGLCRWGDVPDDELAKAHRIFRPETVPARTLLQRAGDPATRLWFIVRGLVRMYYVSADGVERTRGFRAEGELVCSYASALRGEPSPQFIEALGPCQLLGAPRTAFAELCAGHSSWAAVLSAMTERLCLDEERRHRELLTDDATRRYHAFLAAEPSLASRLTQRQIAAYVGISPESLSRIRTGSARS
jgi:CRP-like cAMP-binding protein